MARGPGCLPLLRPRGRLGGTRTGVATVPAAEEAPAGNGHPTGVPTGRGFTATAVGTGPLAGFSLTVAAAVPVACGWTAVAPGQRRDHPPARMAAVYAQLRERLAEPTATLAARLRAVGSCLASAGLGEAEQAASEPLSVTAITGDGWTLLRAGTATIACTVVEISGVSSQVAIAILTGTAGRSEPTREVASATQAVASGAAQG